MAPKAQQPQREKITIPKLYEMKARGEPVSWLTCYDYPTALLMDRAGIDMIEEVKSGQFPQPEHFYSMAEGELEKLLSALKRRRA
jgi:ketopantoate hydroxymethyltransferase